jgi:hypothetical protein
MERASALIDDKPRRVGEFVADLTDNPRAIDVVEGGADRRALSFTESLSVQGDRSPTIKLKKREETTGDRR